jgi:integrase
LPVRVQRVVMPVTEAESWTLLDDEGLPVAPAEGYLAYLSALERSPNTVRAYALSLRLWFEFLIAVGVGWDSVAVDDVARFVAWLRAPAANVVVLASGSSRREASTVNRHLSAVFDFYDHQARSGVGPAAELVAWRRAGGRAYTPFLHHVTKGNPVAVRPVKLAVARRVPRTLSAEEVWAIVAACEHRRDQFLFTLLAETGMRVGQALGLRHADFVSRDRLVRIVPRTDNANGARAKTPAVAVVPVSTPLVRLYSEYMHTEYGDVDSDYVFVNLWAEPVGRPLTYAAVHKLVERLRASTGIEFTPHMLRHTHATDLIRAGVAMEVVARLLTHRSSTTTSQTYIHLETADLRAELERAGVLGTSGARP